MIGIFLFERNIFYELKFSRVNTRANNLYCGCEWMEPVEWFFWFSEELYFVQRENVGQTYMKLLTTQLIKLIANIYMVHPLFLFYYLLHNHISIKSVNDLKYSL